MINFKNMTKLKLTLLLSSFLILALSCENQSTNESNEPYGNPAAEGFNVECSDAAAIAIADEVMEANGGREAWDNTRYVCWSFFGRDDLVWDKWTGNVRIDSGRGVTYLTNINDGTGRAFIGDREVKGADSLQNLMAKAKSTWINHSYWLVMPYKLKDSGVTLKAVGEDTTMDSRMADKLKLTFEGVGRTPQNMYNVWVDKETRLVSQWAYYRNTDDEKPGFINPWKDYKKHGDIMLSRSRGERFMEDIMVFDELPESVFTSPEKPDLKALMAGE